MQRPCQSVASLPVVLFDRGFIATPNYPAKYFVDTDCVWILRVQHRQSVIVTLIDFELDVRREGRCQDYLEVSCLTGAQDT